PADVDVAIPQRRQAERSVRARVFLVADADRGLLQEAYDRREHLFARYALASKVALYAPAYPSEQLRQRDEAAVLRLVPHGAPALVIAVLLAAPCVPPGRLQMTERVRRDPDVRPRGRYRQSLYAAPLRAVTDRASAPIDEGAVAHLPVPPAPRPGRAPATESRRPRAAQRL